MAQWAPFVGLTLLVLTLLLGLARLSQGAVGDGTPRPAREDTTDARREADPVRAVDPGLVRPEETPGTRQAEPRPPDRPEMTTGALLANVALTQGLLGGLVVAGAVFYEIPGDALGVGTAPWIGGLPAVGLGIAVGLGLWVTNEVSASLADAVGAGYDEGLREMLSPDSLGGWVVLLGLVLPTVAFVEEFLFRAAFIGGIAGWLGVSPWGLAVISSVAFALGHGAQGRVGIVVTGTLGLVLAGGFVLTGSLLVVVLAHYLVNALEFLVHEGLGVGRLTERA